MRRAFTLIEVMVAVMIISVVIAALIQMSGNSSYTFSKIKTDSKIGQYASFLINSKKYGFKDNTISLDKLTNEFRVDSDLRKRLTSQKAKIIYTKLESIDMSKFDAEESELDDLGDGSGDQQQQVNSSIVFEIGKTTLQMNNISTSLLRLRLQ